MNLRMAARWSLFLLLVVWGLAYIGWFLHLRRNSMDYVAAERTRRVCERPATDVMRQHFGSASADVIRDMLVSGWSRPEQDGVWSVAKHVLLVLPVPPALQSGAATLEFRMLVPTNEKVPVMPLSISADGKRWSDWQLRGAPEDRTRHITFDPGFLAGKNCLTLQLDLPNAYRPAQLRVNPDFRMIGISLEQIEWRGSPEPEAVPAPETQEMPTAAAPEIDH